MFKIHAPAIFATPPVPKVGLEPTKTTVFETADCANLPYGHLGRNNYCREDNQLAIPPDAFLYIRSQQQLYFFQHPQAYSAGAIVPPQHTNPRCGLHHGGFFNHNQHYRVVQW